MLVFLAYLYLSFVVCETEQASGGESCPRCCGRPQCGSSTKSQREVSTTLQEICKNTLAMPFFFARFPSLSSFDLAPSPIDLHVLNLFAFVIWQLRNLLFRQIPSSQFSMQSVMQGFLHVQKKGNSQKSTPFDPEF